MEPFDDVGVAKRFSSMIGLHACLAQTLVDRIFFN